MPDVSPLAERITAKQRSYEKLAADCWRAYDITNAIRYRAMAEAYSHIVNEDLTWFAQRSDDAS